MSFKKGDRVILIKREGGEGIVDQFIGKVGVLSSDTEEGDSNVCIELDEPVGCFGIPPKRGWVTHYTNLERINEIYVPKHLMKHEYGK